MVGAGRRRVRRFAADRCDRQNPEKQAAAGMQGSPTAGRMKRAKKRERRARAVHFNGKLRPSKEKKRQQNTKSMAQLPTSRSSFRRSRTKTKQHTPPAPKASGARWPTMR